MKSTGDHGSRAIDRRAFLGASGLGAAALTLASPGCELWGIRSGAERRHRDAIAEAPHLPRPTAAQLAWQRAELGVVVHWDLHVFDGKRYVQSRNRVTPIDDIDMFDPVAYDVDQWFDSIKGMGARFAILTSCHETGFRLWQSDANPDHSMKALQWRNGKGDIVRDFVDACRRHGIEPGLYFGARWNSHLGFLDFRPSERATMTLPQYNALIEHEVEEICSRYGPLFELWFDGGILAHHDGGPDVVPIFERHQPDGLFYHSDERRDARWGGSESGTVPDPCWATIDLAEIESDREWNADLRRLLMHGDPDGPHWCPAMSDAPLRGARGRHEWFWEPGDEGAVYDLATLVDMYELSVGHNSTLIMGLTPDDRGLMPDVDTQRCIEWGAAIRERYTGPVVEVGNRIGSEIVLPFEQPASIERIVLEEEIEFGHRIRAWELGGLAPGEDPDVVDTSAWRLLGAGTCVGQKRILSIPEPIPLAAVRLKVTEAVATPLLRRLAVFGSR